VDPRVLEKMLPCFTNYYGNASSREHAFGWQAEELVRLARQQVADLIGAAPADIIFTSGTTESVNLAIKGIAEAYAPDGGHIITAATEHSAVLETCEALAERGYRLTVLPVDGHGVIDLAQLRDSLAPDTCLVSIMAANNETGVLQPIKAIAEVCHERNALFHTDATQAIGKIPFDLNGAEVDLVSFSAHKMYGPKGVGALAIRKRRPRVRLAVQQHGGGHERGIRSGTLNVPGIVGFGEACRIAREEMTAEAAQLQRLRNLLQELLLTEFPEAVVNGAGAPRLPHSLNISFPGIETESLPSLLTDVAVSSGAACASATPELSHVLRAMGCSDHAIRSSLRFGLGRFNTEQEIRFVAQRVTAAVHQLQSSRINGMQTAEKGS